jgi:hypothetical protein
MSVRVATTFDLVKVSYDKVFGRLETAFHLAHIVQAWILPK